MIPITTMIITVQEPFDIQSYFIRNGPPSPQIPVSTCDLINPLDSIPSLYPGTVKYSLKRFLNGDKRRR